MPAFDPNTVVDGRYRIVSRLGSGSMGIVFRGEDIWLGRSVAIKIVDPAQSDAAAAKSFVQEARSLAQIRHDNVVNVYAFGTHAGLHYFAMEYVAGQTLDTIIEEHGSRGTTVELSRALEIIRAIGRGLNAVHVRNLVHRDVKPGNVVIEETTNRPVLVDFGLARRGTSSNPRMTTTAGTPSYMAPEQARDTDGTKTTAAADLYAFACTAFELLTGRPVFDGEDVYEILLAHLNDSPPTISMLRPDLGYFDPAFARALAKSPEYRHESVLAFLDEIDVAHKRETTSIPPRSMRALRSRSSRVDAIRVFMLETDEGLVRQLTRAADRALDGPAIETFTAASDLVAAFERAPARIVILDEDASASPISSVVFALRKLQGGNEAQIIALSRSWDGSPSGLAELNVRELPKPFNLQIVESVLRKALTSSLPPP